MIKREEEFLEIMDRVYDLCLEKNMSPSEAISMMICSIANTIVNTYVDSDQIPVTEASCEALKETVRKMMDGTDD